MLLPVAGDDPAVNIRPEDGQELTSLMEEKKQLHSYLKDYERCTPCCLAWFV